MERRELPFGRLRIAYVRAGQGPPLALLHGGLDDSRSWRRQIEGLEDKFTVLAWDAPGCGRSSDVPESWRMADFADAAAAWLRGIGIERPHVLGLSWGSSVALELYRRHPQLPASLILASAYAGWAGSLPPEETAARLDGVLAAAGLPREELLEGWSRMFSGRASRELREELLAIWADNAGARNPGGYRAIALSMAEADLRDVLPRIRVPTLLLYGELDERSPLKVANASMPGSPGPGSSSSRARATWRTRKPRRSSMSTFAASSARSFEDDTCPRPPLRGGVRERELLSLYFANNQG